METIQEQAKHDAYMFGTIFQNIKNNLGALDACVKELRRCEQEGKLLYEKFTLTLNFTRDKDEELKKKHEELEVLVNQLQQPNQKIEDIEKYWKDL